jgi:hypothetical protein
MEKEQEALKLFEDNLINVITFVNTDDEGNEFVDFFSFADLIAKYEGSNSMGKCYQALNTFLNDLSLYSLDSFLNDFNHKRTELVIIGHALKGSRPEFQVLSECGSLIELVRDNVLGLIAEKENKFLRPFIQLQLETLNEEKNLFPVKELGSYVDFFFETVKTLFNFNKMKAKEIANFKLHRADPKIIRKQMLRFIEQKHL